MLVLAHARAWTIELVRHPGYVVPTVLLPALFFLVFGASSRGGPSAALGMCSFAAFAVIGVAFFQFGVGIAAARESPWERYLRTLPVSPLERLGARLLSAALFATWSAALVIAAAVGVAHAGLSAIVWAELALVLAFAIVPFGLLGIALGYWVSARAAVPLANLLYLGLAYAGGLWFRPSQLPRPVAAVSVFLPTRRLADLLAGVVAGAPWSAIDWGGLAAFSLAFALAALLGYLRDEGRRYR